MNDGIKGLLKGMAQFPTIVKKVLDIKSRVYERVAELSVTAVTSDEPIKKSDLYKYEEKPVEKGFNWSEKKFGACWFHLKGEVPESHRDRHNVVIMSIGGEGLAYDGDEPVDIITPILSVTDVLQPPTGGKRILEVVKDGRVDCLVDCGYNGFSGTFINSAEFRYAYIAERHDDICEYYYDFVTLAVLLGTSSENEKITPEIKKELKELLNASYELFAKGNLSEAKELLKGYYDKEVEEDGVLYTLIGHGHLDLAWLWPERESKRKAVRTFTNAVSLIEKNPSYVFGASQAQMFEWVKESHPGLFERIKKCVESGNIELQGGMWVECDCNMPCGESLIRQFEYGDRFFKENFGRTSRTVWLPDAFGFPHTFPQIIRGVGKESFVTIKLSWNKINKFPYQSFYWVAPDGSRVLSHISPEGSYYNDGTPIAVAQSEAKNIQKDVGRALIIYGDGDGGGGPGEGHIEIAKRSAGLRGSARTETGSVDGFFDELKKIDGLPVFDGELYLEKHQGTLTSQSENKRLNRLAERELHIAEWLSAVAGNRPNLDRPWKRLLFTQFHDVLPGSSIERVHSESRADLKEVIAKAKAVSDAAIASLADGKRLSAINPSPFARDEFITYGGNAYRFVGEGYSAHAAVREAPYFSVGKSYIENESVVVTFGSNGRITSYLDKRKKTEKSLKGLNVLKIYRDKKTHYNAWDIDMDYIKYPENVKLVTQKTFIDGACAVAELKFSYGKSTVRQRISLSGGTAVRIDCEVDWRESHKMLRAEFFPTVYSDRAECDIQFGSIERSTKDDNDLDRARFEVCAHKYVSVKNADGAFAVYSDSKYGYRIKNGVISINLLRSPKYPDENCDMGERRFSYAMDFADNPEEIVGRAYNFSYPLILTEEGVDIEPVVKTDCGNIVVETVKPARDGGIAVRMYERFGRETEARTEINVPYDSIFEADLLENNPSECTESLFFRPHEIKTVILRRETADRTVGRDFSEKELELNERLFDECVKDPVDTDKAENLLKRGADPLGAYSKNENLHLYGELVELTDEESGGRDFVKLTELFLRYGMNVAYPRISYDGQNNLNPLRKFAENPNRYTARALGLLLENGLDGDSVREFWQSGVSARLESRENPVSPETREELEYLVKMMLLAFSYERIAEGDRELAEFLNAEGNAFDPKGFRDIDAYEVVFDVSHCKRLPEFNRSVITVIEKESARPVWKFGVGFTDREWKKLLRITAKRG